MPYIAKDARDALDIYPVPSTPGEMNYMITCIIDYYIKQKGLSYTAINEVIGVLECAKLELYRRVASPYEDKAIEKNGDVYSAALL